MTQSDERATQPSGQDVAVIVGGGPGKIGRAHV